MLADFEDLFVFYLTSICQFLMSEPIIYLVGFMFCSLTLYLIKKIIS